MTQATAKIVLTNEIKKVSQASGNVYFTLDLPFIGRKANFVINPRWAVAQDEAIKNKSRNTQPSFSLLVTDMERAVGTYEGTGSVWMQKRGLHKGNFVWDGKNYNLELTRPESDKPTPKNPEPALKDLELTITELLPVELGDM